MATDDEVVRAILNLFEAEVEAQAIIQMRNKPRAS
jgi:hypothetical protein